MTSMPFHGDGVTTVGRSDQAFPDRLRRMAGAPAVVHFCGDPSAWRPPAVAIVGTRTPTSFGESAARSLATAAVRAGFNVISGLSPGVDSVAHAAAVEAGGRTTAVLGGGIGTPEDRELAARIVAGGGALLSEQPFETQPSPAARVARNRLQAALADAVLVAQTGIEGGTLHTVRFAAQQGRPVRCPAPEDPTGQSAGLAVLLEVPAARLPALLPAWAGEEELARRLGTEPLARPIPMHALADWFRSAFSGGRAPGPGGAPRWP